MTPFEQFRLWLRRAPVGERVMSGVAAAAVLGLLGWLIVPVTQGDDSDDGFDGGAAVATAGPENTTTTVAGPAGAATPDGATPTGGSEPGTGVTGSSGSTGGGSRVAVSGGTAPAGCTSPPGGDNGVSGSEIKIAITLVNIVGPAGNNTFGVPPADEQELDYKLAIDALNKAGGVACRKMVADFHVVNPADRNNQQGTCLDIASKKVFAVIDAGGYYGAPSMVCYPQHELPFFGTGRIADKQRDDSYPYLFGTGGYTDLYRNGVLALNQAGFFSAGNGFKKLGFIYRDCFGLPDQVRALIRQVGVKDIVEHSVGCPEGNFANPADIQQAVLKFQQNQVTHVTEAFFHQDFANFTTVAQRQGFRPKYGILDDAIIPTTQGNLHVDYDNVEGALIGTSDRYGDESSGIAPNAATQKCDAIHKAAGRPPTYEQDVGFGGVACNQIWMLATAIEHAPALQRKLLVDGLRAAKSFDTAYPRGPVDFTAPRAMYGGQFWRLQRFEKACTCWKVTDPTFHPRFP
jgi:hypothetical protein